MRPAIVLAFLLACGSESDPHVVGACEGWTDNMGNPFAGMCEAACNKPPKVGAKSCDTVGGLNCPSFSFEGTDGCCIPEGTTIKFFECAN